MNYKFLIIFFINLHSFLYSFEKVNERHFIDVPVIAVKDTNPLTAGDPLPTTDYRLQIGDVLLLELYLEPQTRTAVTVDPSGAIQFMGIPFLPALGKTIPEVKKNIEEALSRFYRDPIVSCALLEIQADYYTIVGEITNPGTKPLIGPVTLLDAIGVAGGITSDTYRDRLEDMADLDHTFLARNGEVVPIDFWRLIHEGDLSENVKLLPGDYLFFPSKTAKHIYVLGEVRRQTVIDTFHSTTLLEAISEGGGTTLRASSRVLVLRGSLARPTRFLIDFNRISKGHAPDFPLENGDIVFVPARQFSTIEEIAKAGVGVFVSSIFTWAGQRTFYDFEPSAAGVLSGASSVVAPIIPAAPAAAAPAAGGGF